jgi:hypothetical protein
VLASLVVDGIAPSVSTSKSSSILSVVTNANADTYKPTIQTDMIISTIVAGLHASGIAPILNASNYQQIIKYNLYIARQLEFKTDIVRMLEYNSDIKNSNNSALKI